MPEHLRHDAGDEPPIDWPDVFLAECRALDPSFEIPNVAQPTVADLNQTVFARGHAALCLSGGGIRSASFAVGVIQALTGRGVIGKFHYLSTVSGGGFAGAWLTSWLHRATPRGPDPASGTPAEVAELVAARGGFNQMEQQIRTPDAVEPWPLTRLRQYTRYLSPQAGLFSADAWSLISTMLRNLVLNWMVLVPLLAAAILVPRLHYSLIHLSERPLLQTASWSWWSPEGAVLALAAVAYFASVAFFVGDLPSYGNRRWSQYRFLLLCLLPLCGGTLALTYFWALNEVPITGWKVPVVTGLSHAMAWVVIGIVAGNRHYRPRTWLAAAASGTIPGFGLWLLTDLFPNGADLHQMYIAVAFPAVLLFILMAVVAFIGFAGTDINGADLEWWSRFGGWVLIVVALWLAVCAIVLGGPWVVRQVPAWMHATRTLGVVTPALGALGAWLARPMAERSEPSMVRRVGLLLAAPAFAVLLLIGVAVFDDRMVRALARAGDPNGFAAAEQSWRICEPSEEEQSRSNQCHPADAGAIETFSLFGVLLAAGLAMSRFVPANKFSLHGMYRQRVTRAFLGASRFTRTPNPFTGFDEKDDVELSEFRAQRPFHVVNTTLNRKDNHFLGQQERHAESFTLTPLHAGNKSLGYRPVHAYGYDAVQKQAMTLGTAITISGAAASPAMGSYSTPSLAFLLTLLNARMGVWLGNPGPKGRTTWRRSDPTAGVGPIIREMLGLTTEENPYVYLSDGGHFDNLGLWEMVLRRCKFIVVVDAGADAEYCFSDFAKAIRQVRIDHGVRIEMDSLTIDQAHQGQGNTHFVTGRIHYEDVDGAGAVGTLLYVKPAISGHDEPIDVINYWKAHPTFPNESTANQWFSEAQFESYRMLGQQSIKAAFGDRAIGDLGALCEAIQADAASRARGSVVVPAADGAGLLRGAWQPSA